MLILRSIRDVNLPKFQGEDIPLFEGIISDLFPDANLPSISYPSLQRCIDQVLVDLNLQKHQSFLEKII
jgi:dynein heavy chain